MSNEPAERLRARGVQMYRTGSDVPGERLASGILVSPAELNEALAAERKATVERIRTLLDLSTAKDAEFHWRETVAAILDAEDAR